MKKNWKKSPLWPAFLSAAVAPGMGQLFNREFSKGILLLVASIGSFFWFSYVLTEQLSMILPGTSDQWIQNKEKLQQAVLKLVEQHPQMFMTFQILIVVVWVFGVVDAYITARKRLTATVTTNDPSNEIEP